MQKANKQNEPLSRKLCRIQFMRNVKLYRKISHRESASILSEIRLLTTAIDYISNVLNHYTEKDIIAALGLS